MSGSGLGNSSSHSNVSGADFLLRSAFQIAMIEKVTYSSAMNQKTSKSHGGARAGAGRKSTYREDTRPVRIPVSQIDAVRLFLHSRILSEKTITPRHLHPAPVALSIPVFASGVRAGFPSPADDHAEPGLDLNQLIENRASTFCAWAEGDSMQDLGILDGDLMVIDRSLTARHDDVVVADLNGSFTVKRLVQKSGNSFLMPANPDYPPIPINPDDDVRIWGVVIRVIHDLRATGRRKRPANSKTS